ncbi:HU family DNA-binding protein [Paracoccus sp. 11-3]|uniref:HU family DNA-binding protein n=1 Tax=Paracoccus amoyensis TaxID=2760093 RepID=A0A926GDW5_9RHOB|nr:HU family DNA-binding protein [Paracoccus amoyensis]MBC9246721.1 HU family DNA-binding protein [Paracoccus amoyensis]
MSNFNKAELIKSVAQTTGKSQKEVEEIITATLSVIREETDAGKTVNLPGFGRFSMKHRAARQGRNPATGAVINIAASSSLGFKPTKSAA